MSANVKYLTLSDAPRKGQKQPAYSVEFLRSFVQETLALVEEGLRRDGVVRMHDFGTFQLKWVNERSGRNPRTGEPLVIPGQYRVVFKPAGKIEHRLNRRYAHLRPEIVETPLVPPRTPSAQAPQSEKFPDIPPIPIFLRPPYPPRPHRIRFDFAEEEESNFEEIEVGALEEVLAPTSASPASEAAEQQPARRNGAQIRWYGSFLLMLLAALLLLVTPIRERDLKPPASEMAQKVELNLNPANGRAKAANGTAKNHEAPPAFPGGTHQVAVGDNLWQLSHYYYLDPFLWPNIYRVNTEVVSDPDVLEPEEMLTLPVLHGPHDKLTPVDRRNLAEGYFLVFDYYRQTQKHLAPFALWAAVRYDPQILDTHSAAITANEIAFLKAHDVEAVASR